MPESELGESVGLPANDLERRHPRRVRVKLAITVGLTVALLGYLSIWISKRSEDLLIYDSFSTAQVVRGAEWAAVEYHQRHGRWPTTLQALSEDPEMIWIFGQHEPRDRVSDAWGRDLLYSSSNGKPRIVSYGRDGKPGGVGPDFDITSDDARLYRREYAWTLGQFLQRRESGYAMGISTACGLAAVLLSLYLTPDSESAPLTRPGMIVAMVLTTLGALFLVSLIALFHLFPHH